MLLNRPRSSAVIHDVWLKCSARSATNWRCTSRWKKPMDISTTRSTSPRRSSRQAESLRWEHPKLYLAISELVEQAERNALWRTGSEGNRQLGDGFADFREQLQHHEEQEQTLIVQTLNEEIGGGD